MILLAIPVWLLFSWMGRTTGFDAFRACDGPDPELHAEVTVAGRTAQVDGTTNLPEGAVLFASFAHPHSRGFADHASTTTVQSGAFRFAEDLADLPAGPTTLTLEFSIGWYEPSQAPAVIDRYGPTGQCLDGPDVSASESGGPPRLFAHATFELPADGS
ncbi:MAG: hypothetical protein U0R79_11290 [Propionicimonas sp.]